MSRQFYLELAATGRRVPIAAHLVLHERPDPEAILVDGARLAGVMAETADRFHSPLALPIMDLTLEKELLLTTLGLGGDERAKYHFEGLPPASAAADLRTRLDPRSLPRIAANLAALTEIAGEGRLTPIGMSIGPFSLVTKLMADPITAIYLAGSGLGPEDDETVAQLDALLELGELVIEASCAAQIDAGAKAVFVCEPAANIVYFSPKQQREGSDSFKRYVIEPNLRLADLIRQGGADLIFHDCGELVPEMISAFAALRPVMLSLGSSVRLWEIEPQVPKDVVLYGNLPTKKFYSDEEIPLSAVREMADEIAKRLTALQHPFIIGSECDVLSMPGYEKVIMEKVLQFCGRAPR